MFIWGVVEDVKDPLQLGRARVRWIGKHSEFLVDTGIDQLPWCMHVGPGPSVSGVSTMAGDLLPGSWVVGLPQDDTYQVVLILGSVPGKPVELNTDPAKGFKDPEGVHPREIGVSSISGLARGDHDHPVNTRKNAFAERHAAISIPTGEESTSSNTFAAEYPHNKVIETEAGHVIELDNTTGAERVHVAHVSGTSIEMLPDGSMVISTVGDQEDITDGDSLTRCSNRKVSINGDGEILVTGAYTLKVLEGADLDITKDLNITAENINMTATGDVNVNASSVNTDAPAINDTGLVNVTGEVITSTTVKTGGIITTPGIAVG